MSIRWCYRGQSISDEQIAFIRQHITDHPQLSRWKLSRQLCQAWQWKQANGALRDMVCRGLLLLLHRAGEIQLPAVRRRVRNRLVERERPEPVIPDNRAVHGPLGVLTPLEFLPVRRTPEEPLFNSLLEQYHYLGYKQPVGEHLKYLVKARGQAIACLAWSSAPPHLKLRDRYLGWSEEARERNVHLLAYNTRFLILPWVEVPHLASHILGSMARIVPPRLAAHLRPPDLLVGDVCRHVALCGHLLSRGQLARDRRHDRTGASCTDLRADPSDEEDDGVAPASQVPGDSATMKRPRVDVNLKELDQIIEPAARTRR